MFMGIVAICAGVMFLWASRAIQSVTFPGELSNKVATDIGRWATFFVGSVNVAAGLLILI